MKRILTLAMTALAMMSARASVVINETNFPDEAMRYALIDSSIDADGDGILSDEEIENANWIYLQGCKNLKGLELFKNIESIMLTGDEESYSSITSIDLSKFPKLFRLDIYDYAITSLDATFSPNLWNVDIARCREFTSIKVDSERDDLAVFLNHLPKLTSMENCVFNNVRSTGAETDYRQAPPSVSYTVSINVRKGDANWDGKVEIADITAIIATAEALR